MVLWVGGHGGRLRLFHSKRMVLSGSLLFLILIYYVALPEPHHSLYDRTPFQVERQFRTASKGSALADDTEIMMALPARDRSTGDYEAMPWFDTESRDRLEQADGESRVKFGVDCLRDSVSGPCLAGSVTSSTSGSSKEEGMDMLVDMDPLTSGAAALAADAKANESHEMDPAHMNPLQQHQQQDSGDWSREKELESIQEEEDDQGAEKEDGRDRERFEEEEEALEEAEERLEEAEEALEEAILEIEEDRLLEQTEYEGDQLVEGPLEEGQDYEEPLSEFELASLGEGESGEEDDEGLSVRRDMHRFVEGLFHDDYSAAEMDEYEREYRLEDRLGQAGPSETMDDEE